MLKSNIHPKGIICKDMQKRLILSTEYRFIKLKSNNAAFEKSIYIGVVKNQEICSPVIPKRRSRF